MSPWAPTGRLRRTRDAYKAQGARAHEVESVKRSGHDQQLARNTGSAKALGVARVLGGEEVQASDADPCRRQG